MKDEKLKEILNKAVEEVEEDKQQLEMKIDGYNIGFSVIFSKGFVVFYVVILDGEKYIVVKSLDKFEYYKAI